jgi:membrane-associated phospholipid phosphatase
MKKNKKLLFKNISLEALVFFILFLVSITVFALLAHEVVGENEDWFDTRAFNFLKAHSSPASISYFKFMTFFGSTYFLFSAYAVVVGYLVVKRRYADAIDIAIIGITSYTLLYSLKAYFARHRPPLPLFEPLTNYSFPSGHALSGFIFCSVLIYLTWKSSRAKTWKFLLSGFLLLFFLLVGLSRIVLRYHYASDVLAGFCIGFAWVLFSLWLQRKLRIKTTT